MTQAEIWVLGDSNNETAIAIGHNAQFLPLFDDDDPSTLIIFADGSRVIEAFIPDYFLIIIREECAT